MKTYNVRVPITGVADVQVEAESEEQAIELALDSVTSDDLTEWEGVRCVVQGNVFHGHTNEIEVEEV
jgi:hypothetical protein